MKREVASTIVERGVNERIRLTEVYEKKKEELLRQHQEVQNQFEDEKLRVRHLLQQEYEGRLISSRVEEEVEPRPNKTSPHQ